MLKIRNVSLGTSLIALAYVGTVSVIWAIAPSVLDAAPHWRMKPNAALGLTFIGLSLLCFRFSDSIPRRRTTLRAAGHFFNAVAGVIAVATLIEYLTGIDLHIDLLWARDAIDAEGANMPGRMAPNSALCILFLSLETFFARTLRRARALATMSLIGTTVVTLMALLGYVYGAKNFYSISSFVRIAPSTAATALLFCITQVLDARWGTAYRLLVSRYSGSRMAKKFFPILLLPVAAGWMEIYGRELNWWSREDGATMLVAVVVVVFFAFILRAAQAQNLVDEQEERVSSALRTLNAVGTRLSAERDQKVLTQVVTDAATEVTGAEFGAFFYKVHDDSGSVFMLYTVSGVPIEKFSKFPMPRSTAVFAPTFQGEGVIRSPNIRQDPRYGKNAPYKGMPEGHLPVTSFLSVPVISPSGVVLGGLFFGHSEEGRFTAAHEDLVSSLAAQAAVALDNSQLYRKLSHAVKAREDFLSMASHELKTPLTSLTLQVQLAQRRMDTEPEKAARSLALIHEQARRINGLVEDLLDVSRIELGKLQLNIEEIDLAEMVESTAARLNDFLRKAGCELRLDIGVPRPFRIEADRFRLDQVFENLLSNCAKYGAGKPVTLRLRETADHAEITVLDEGIGMPKDRQGLIFNRFERVTDNANISGLGLGLFISREIVTAHHGTIVVDSEPGHGAAFTVILPQKQPSI